MLPFTPDDLSSEIAQKTAQLTTFLRQKGLGGIWLNRVNNFSWLTGGMGDNQIAWGSEFGAASLLVLNDGRKFVIGAHSEIPRLMSEGLGGLGYEPVELKWYEDDIKTLDVVHPAGAIAGDVERPWLVPVNIGPLRYSLTDTEIKKFRWIGRQSSEAVAEVVRQITPGMAERELEAKASTALMRRGLRPTVLLIGSDDRLFRFRHALPSDDKTVDKYAMVNICAKRWGLVVSVTRLVHFGPLTDVLRKRYAAVASVNARFMAALKPGKKIAQLFEEAKDWYKELGFPGEWEFHHQGGPAGYSEREYLLQADSREVVQEHQAFALNPTIQGSKAEDTVIVFADQVENITEAPGWPVIPVKVGSKVYNSPDVLIQGAPQTAWETIAAGTGM